MTGESAPQWPELTPEHPLSKLLTLLPAILETTGHCEIYGIKLDAAAPFHTKLILQKFLRANHNHVEKAKEQLSKALTWRKAFQPEKCLGDKFPQDKFAGLGYVTVLEKVPGSVNEKDICTWNIYGAVKDNKKTFGHLDAYVYATSRHMTLSANVFRFMRWRIALMELGISKLDLASATKPIPDFGQGPDPYQGIQVHEYMNVSFIRQDPLVKAASSKGNISKGVSCTVDANHVQPSRSSVLTIPRPCQGSSSSLYRCLCSGCESKSSIQGHIYLLIIDRFTAMKLILAKETVKKFTVMSYPNQLATELGQSVPKVYGGTGEPLETIGETLAMEQA